MPNYVMLIVCSLMLFINFNQLVNAQNRAKGQEAPEWSIPNWINEEGEVRDPIHLKDFEGKVVYLLAFQSWCPGCHSVGFPTLKAVKEHFADNEEVVFLAVQTVFEGHHTNTIERLVETQQKYDLQIPFGHDVGDETTNNRPNLMYHYKTGGTPWVLIINKEGKLIFSDFHIKPTQAKEIIRKNL